MHIGWQKWKATRKGNCLESCKHTIVEWVSEWLSEAEMKPTSCSPVGNALFAIWPWTSCFFKYFRERSKVFSSTYFENC